jgi:hypothetical protein
MEVHHYFGLFSGTGINFAWHTQTHCCSCHLLLQYPVDLCLCFFVCNFVSFERIGIDLVTHDKEHLLWGLLLHLKQHNVFHTCSESVLELLQLNFRKIHDSSEFFFLLMLIAIMWRLWEVCRATAAAAPPTYFPPAYVTSVDGTINGTLNPKDLETYPPEPGDAKLQLSYP